MIRPPQPGDAQALCALCKTMLGHTASTALIEQRIRELSDDPAYYLAVYEDAVHGVAGFLQAQTYHLLYGEQGWNIIALAVKQDAQKQGIGRQLVEALEQHARAQGHTFVRLNSRMERPDAHAFYEHLGYRNDKVQKRFIKTIG